MNKSKRGLFAFLIFASLTVLFTIQTLPRYESSAEQASSFSFVGTMNPSEPISIMKSIDTVVELVEDRVELEVDDTVGDVVIEPIETVELTLYDVPLDEDLQLHIIDISNAYGIDPSIVMAVIKKESSYRSYIIGDNGRSYGLMQIQPKWHRDRMESLGCTDLLDPYQNVAVGIDYLAELISTGKPVEWVLMAYNGGPSYANSKMKSGIVTDYAKKVISDSDTFNTYTITKVIGG